MDTEPGTARVFPAERWHESLLQGTAKVGPAGRDRTAVRRFVGTPPEMVQPMLEDTVVAVHLGGPKRVRRWSGGRASVHDVRVGSLTLMPAFQANRWLTEGPIDFAHIVLPPGFVERIVIEEFDRDPRAGAVADRVGVEDPLPCALARALVDEAGGAAGCGGSPGGLYREGLFLTFAIALLRRYSTFAPGRGQPNGPLHSPAKGGLTPRQLRRVIDFMAEHLARDLSVADILGTVPLSRAQFFRAFKQSTGKSPYRLLTEMRVERAKRLLERSDLPLDAVGAAVGFASPGEFSCAFRRHAGATPRAFRVEPR